MPSIVGLSRNYSKPYREIRLVACWESTFFV